MRFALIQATGPQDLDQYAPLGLAAIAAWLREHAPFFEPACYLNIETLLEAKPDVVGISSVTQNFGIARQWARTIKAQLGVRIILGGPHISCLPDSLPREVDFGIIGEGEETIVELLAALEAGSDRLDDIPGICFHRRGEIIVTPMRQTIEDLDSLPMPDREWLAHPHREFHLMTSRGCPYQCSFCSASRIWGPFRAYGAERVVKEIRRLFQKYGADRIHIYDDLFIADQKRFFQFVEGVEKSGLCKSISLSAAVRANLVDKALCEGLVRCGIREVTFGAESADDDVLRELKAGVCAADNERALSLLAEYNIGVNISMMVGIPGQSPASMRETYRFLARQMMEGRLAGAEVHLLAPFPGTVFFDRLRKQGMVNETVDWSCFGRPWHGLILNDSFPSLANELVAYDRAMRILFASMKRPCIAILRSRTDRGELERIADLFPFRAVYGVLTEDSQVVIRRGGTDVALISLDSIREIMKTIDPVPVLLLEGAEALKTRDIRSALVHFFASGRVDVMPNEKLRVMRSDRLAEKGLMQVPAESGTDASLQRDPLELFSFEKIPEGDFKGILDQHAEWIAKQSGRKG